MTDETTLLPCPFCGGEANHFGGGGYHAIRCSKCGVTNEWLPERINGQEDIWLNAFDSSEEAAKAWNRRYTEDDLK